MVEGARLEIVCASKAYRGFESLSLRHLQKYPLCAGVFVNDEEEWDLNPRKEGSASERIGTNGIFILLPDFCR